MHTSRYDIIAALAHVHVIVRVHRGTHSGCRQMSNNFIGIHIGAGARASLKDIYRKLSIVFAIRH